MAKGRMLNKKISLDDKVNRLSCDTARLLFTWIIAHLDQDGRFYADPSIVKNLVFPRRKDVNLQKVSQFLNEMDKLELIERYKIGNEDYLLFPNFDENQPGLRKDREAKSDIPPPDIDGFNPSNCRSDDGNTPPEQNRSIKEVEGATECQRQLLEELQKLPQWGDSHPGEDLKWLIELKEEYPALWIPHIRHCRDYHSKKTKHSTAQWKSRLRNWMKNEWQKKEVDIADRVAYQRL